MWIIDVLYIKKFALSIIMAKDQSWKVEING